MSARSYKKHYETISTDALQHDQPLSALASWTLRDNLQHLIDSAHQYRVNWVASNAGEAYRAYVGFSRQLLRWSFPGIVTRVDRPPSFDVRVGAKLYVTNATCAIITARIKPFSMVGSMPIWQTTVTTTSTTAHWAIDTQATFSIRPWVDAVRNLAVIETSGFRVVSCPIWTFEVDVVAKGGSEMYAEVVGAQVREYP